MPADEATANEAHDARRVEVYERLRPRLMGVAYRVLGTVVDAEDVVQEAWLRWAGVDLDSVETDEAYLITITTRLALSRLRKVKVQREVYVGSWLPEPVAMDSDPAAAVELADSLSMALLVTLETLSPLERAAFVLHDVFQRQYPEVAAALGRSEPAVRQLVRRARAHVESGHARYRADQATHAQVVERFLAACENADIDQLMEILAPDAVIVSDGGGVAPAPRQPVHGRDKVARLLVGIAGRVPQGTVFSFEVFNGALGLVARLDGVPTNAMAVTVGDGLVQSLHLIANPSKLEPLRRDRPVDMH